jgi:hypothetical protein
MRLKIGDILYLKDEDSPYSDTPFPIIFIRDDFNDDICIKWADGGNWWWGQIGSFEPWTIKFMTEKEYKRNKKLKELI